MSYISNYPNKLSLSSRHHRRRYRRRCRRRCHHHRYRHRHRCRRLRSLKPRVQVIPPIGHARVLLLRSHVHPHILRSSRHRAPTHPLGSSHHRSSTPLYNTDRHASGRPRHYSVATPPVVHAIRVTMSLVMHARHASGHPRPRRSGLRTINKRNCHHQIPVLSCCCGSGSQIAVTTKIYRNLPCR